MKYREVIKSAFFDLVNAKDDYINIVESMNAPVNMTLVNSFVQAVLKLMAPITSHTSEYIWKELLGNTVSIFDSGLPTPLGVEDASTMIAAKDYVDVTLKRARKQKQHMDSKGPVKIAKVYLFPQFPSWKLEAVKLVEDLAVGEAFPEKRGISQALGKNAELKKNMKTIMPFIAELEKRFSEVGRKAFTLDPPFNEFELWVLMEPFVISNFGIEKLEIEMLGDDVDLNSNPSFKSGEPGHPSFVFES